MVQGKKGEFVRLGEHAEIQMDILERGASLSGVDGSLKNVERLLSLYAVLFISVDQEFAYETLGFSSERPDTSIRLNR